jgi:asparagine synthase (glutamine-hydrolysing)
MAEMEHDMARLDTVLQHAVWAALDHGCHPAVLYSAGLDSALIARICQELGHTPLLLALGTSGSRDREFVERSTPYLGLPTEFITVDEHDIARALPAVDELLRAAGVPVDIMHRSLGVGMYLACEDAGRRGIGLLLSGQGADALFAGFQKYQRVPLDELPAVLERDVENAVRRDFVRDRAIARSFSVEFAAPFLDPGVVEVALSVPPELKLGPAGNKLVLRGLAEKRGLPDFIAQRPKKAMQYSTGIEKAVKSLVD